MRCSSGCKLVSTNVGGIPELLPPYYGHFVDPDVDSLMEGLRCCIAECSYDYPITHPIPRTKEIETILSIYDWKSVCLRTTCVYKKVRKAPRKTYWDLIRGMYRHGLRSFLLLMLEWILLVLLNILLDLFSASKVVLSRKRQTSNETRPMAMEKE